jgi:hypothetical protein
VVYHDSGAICPAASGTIEDAALSFGEPLLARLEAHVIAGGVKTSTHLLGPLRIGARSGERITHRGELRLDGPAGRLVDARARELLLGDRHEARGDRAARRRRVGIPPTADGGGRGGDEQREHRGATETSHHGVFGRARVRVKIAAIVTTPRRALLLVAATLAVAIVAIHVRVVVGGRTWADVRYHTEVAPPRLAAAEAVQGGELPAWWEGSGLGVPLAAEPSHGAMYAPGWIAATPRALDLLAIAHLIWGALGIAAWARRSGASAPAALAAGLLAGASGILASAAVRGALPALAHLPWIGVAAAALAGAEDRRGRARAALALGGLLGLVATSGVLAGLVHGLALALALGARRGAGGALAAAIAAGLAIGAAQWLPALAQLGEGAGGEVHGLPLARLLELIVPGAFGAGDPARGVAALAGGAPWAPSLFAGAPLLALAAVRTPPGRVLAVLAVLAALALVAGRGGWPAWLGAPELHVAALVMVLAANAGAGLDALLAAERRALLALGGGVACAGVALGAVFVLRLRQPDAAAAIDRALLDGGLGLAAMALALALAWRARVRARGKPGGSRVPAAVLVLLVLPSAGAAPSVAPVAPRALVEEPPPWARAAVAAAGAGDEAAPRRVFRPAFMHPGAESLADAMETLAGGAGWRWGLGAARSEDPARPRAHDATWLAAARDGGALLDRFGIALAILPATLVVPRYLTSLGVRGDWALVAFPAAPAASVMHGAEWADGDADALARLFPADGKLPRGTVVLRGVGPSRPDPGPPRPCTIRRWRPGDLELSCTLPADGYAVVSSASADGWSATVGGARVPWVTADVLRRAVALPAGEHVVRWTYEAPLLAEGLVLAGLGLAGLAGLGVAAARRRRRRPA